MAAGWQLELISPLTHPFACPSQYREKFLQAHLTAKIPRIGSNGRTQQLPPQKANDADGSYVYYTRGFGETPFQDHTSVGRR